MSVTVATSVAAPARPAAGPGSAAFPPLPTVRPWLAVLLLSTFCGFLFFYGLNAGELYRTESLRAIIGAQFLRSGNWIVPTLYGEPLFTKPPGMYAAIALLSWPFGGVHDWTARLPAAFAATAMVFLFYWYFGRQFGRLAGLIAAAILPVSLMWLDKATAAEIDMLQVAWVSAAILFFLRALEAEEDREPRFSVFGFRFSVADLRSPEQLPLLTNHRVTRSSWLWWLAALLCVAGGVLTKWTAPAFFYGTLVPLLWWRGRLRLLWCRPHVVSALLAAGICLAWITAAVSLTGWHAFYDTVSREAMMRLLPSHHHRPYPWLETLAHPFKVFASSLPWSLVALLTLRPRFAQQWDERGRRVLQALHCWLWPNLVFWSVIPEHATRHSFPMFPAVAGLAALVWIGWLGFSINGKSEIRNPKLPRIVLLGMLCMWLLVKVAFVQVVIPARNLHREPRAKGELLATLVPEGQILFLSRLKDEGIMFYYGRSVRRLESFAHLPSSGKPLYCILDESEWRHWPASRPVIVIQRLCDEQGAPIVLVQSE